MPANLDSNRVMEPAWEGDVAAVNGDAVNSDRTVDQKETLSQQRRQSQQSSQQQSQVRARRVVTDFEYGETLGEGSYSTVAAAKDKQTGRIYAIKILDKRHIIKEKKSKYVEIEKKALHRMDHPGIVKLYWTFQDQTSLYYVIDLAKNGELHRYIKKLGAFDLETTRFYAAEILSAVEHVHSRGVIHRDVKPENILLDENMHIKLTDFGSAKILEADIGPEGQDGKEERASSFVGTAEYVSPELLTDKSACKASDFWAIGCITYQLLVGRPPFKGSNEYQTFQKIIKLEYSFPDGFNEVARDLVSKLLVSDPVNRLGGGPNGVTDIKSHPFFEDVDWDNLFKSEAPRLRPYLPRGTSGETELRSDNDLFMGSEFGEGRRDPFIEMLGRSGETSYPDPLLASEGVAPTDIGNTENNDTEGVEGFIEEKDENLGRGIGDDITRDRRRRLEEQKEMPWFKHLGENEICLRTGTVNKRKGLLSKKRILVLTDAPRLLYFTQENMDHMGEINWSTKIVPELKGRKHFFVHTPKKTYYFEDPNGKAQEWVNDINQIIVDKFGPAA